MGRGSWDAGEDSKVLVVEHSQRGGADAVPLCLSCYFLSRTMSSQSVVPEQYFVTFPQRSQWSTLEARGPPPPPAHVAN